MALYRQIEMLSSLKEVATWKFFHQKITEQQIEVHLPTKHVQVIGFRFFSGAYKGKKNT